MNYLHKYKFILIAGLVCFSLYACKKNNYLTDGGTQTAVTNATAYDYLAGNAYHIFDTLLLIVDHYGLKDSINKAGTFFAPTDYSVNRVMIALNVQALDSLYSYITSKFITQYLFADTAITLTGATTTAKIYNNWADTVAGVKKTAYTTGVVSSTITYYILQYVKINGYVDGSPGAPANDPTDGILNCQTSDLITLNGSKLHVLSNASSLSVK